MNLPFCKCLKLWNCSGRTSLFFYGEFIIFFSIRKITEPPFVFSGITKILKSVTKRSVGRKNIIQDGVTILFLIIFRSYSRQIQSVNFRIKCGIKIVVFHGGKCQTFRDNVVGDVGSHEKSGVAFCFLKCENRLEIFGNGSQKFQISVNIISVIKTIF